MLDLKDCKVGMSLILLSDVEHTIYSYFEKGCREKCARDNPER